MVEVLGIQDSFTLLFEPFWFNSAEYATKQTAEGAVFLYQKDPHQIYIKLYKKDGYWLSPWRAPFGSFEVSKGMDLTTMYGFIKELIEKTNIPGMKGIRITAAPDCYDLNKADLLDETLIHAGFKATVTESNYHLETSMGEFETFIHDSEKRRLKKCQNAGFEWMVDQHPDYDEVHALISACRKRKGHPLSMNAEDFKKMFLDFPDRYLLFSVKDNGKTIAAAIGVKVRSDILYNFLPADHEDYLNYSPMVLMNKGMYDYCRQNGYRIYDMGIATSGGVPNEGLIRFKEHLGGMLSHKYSYELNF